MSSVLQHRLPEPALWALPADALARELDGPTLVHVPGHRTPELFVSVLLHGDEVSGWDAIRSLLDELGPTLPRALTLLIGNVTAAAHRVRHMPNEPDFNRVWRANATTEVQFPQQVLAGAKERGFFAAVDVHNNSGTNPHYSVLVDDRPETLGLAALFSPRAVFTRSPDSVSTLAFSQLGTALTIECGQPADPMSATRARRFLHELLTLDELPNAAPESLEMYRSDVRVLIDERISFDFNDSATLQLRPELERANFRALPAGTLMARSSDTSIQPLTATNGAMHDVTDRYFLRRGNDIVLREEVIPAMYTTDREIARQDCLCYFMERLAPLPSEV